MTLSTLQAITKADDRWARRTSDDPAPQEYLERLAAAVDAVAPAVAIDGAAGTRSPAGGREVLLEEQLDQLRAEHVTLHTCIADLEHGLLHKDTELASAIDALHSARVERDEANALLAGAEAAHGDAAVDFAQRRDNDQRILADTGAARDHYRQLLAQLVDAVLEEWHPDQPAAVQVERAVQCVTAARDQLDAREGSGGHLHRYPRLDDGTTAPCECGKPFPPTARRTAPTVVVGAA